MKKHLALLATAMLAAASLGSAQGVITIGSGSTTGVYFPVATGMASLINEANLGLRANARSTGGSVFNLNAIGSGELQIALVQNDTAFYAFNGTGLAAFEGKPLKSFRAIASLYPEIIHVIARADAKVTKITDLKGKRVIVGDVGSGTELNARQILEINGMTFADLGQTIRTSATAAIGLIQDGKADVAFYTSGLGNASIAQIAQTTKTVMVEIDRATAQALGAKYPYYTDVLIPGGTYKGVDVTTPTVAVQAMLVVAESVSADDVYKISKTLFDNVANFQKIHPNLARYFTLAKAVKGLPIALHPGAQRYFKEKGLIK